MGWILFVFSRLIYPANLSPQTVGLILCSTCHIAQLLQMLSLWIFFFLSDFLICGPEWQKVSGLWTDTIRITWGFFFLLFNASGSISSDSNSVGQKKDKGSTFLEWESLSFILKGDHGPW